MLESVSASDKAVEVKMVRTAFPGTILLTEGDTDLRFFGRFTSPSQCWLIPAHGKDNAVGAMKVLESEDFEGTLAIVDADFWRLISPDEIPKNVYITDYHDVEIMICETEALNDVLKEHGSERKIALFLKSTGAVSIRQALYKAAQPFGLLRFVSEKRNLQLKFQELPYDKIVNKATLEVDLDRLISVVLRVSDYRVKDREIRTALDEETPTQSAEDRREVCCGHDVVAIMCIGLRSVLGSLDAKTAGVINIAVALRLAYDSRHLRETALYSAVKEWESLNQPFKVFSI